MKAQPTNTKQVKAKKQVTHKGPAADQPTRPRAFEFGWPRRFVVAAADAD